MHSINKLSSKPVMTRDNTSAVARKYAFYGFSIGFGMWIVALTVEALVTKQAFNGGLFWNIHKGNVAFFFIDLIPFILGYGGYQLGLFTERKSREIEAITNKNKQRNRDLIDIVDSLKCGNFDVSNDLQTQDKLINSILDLRDSLKSSTEEENSRKKEDEQRHWVAQGLAKFGEILRANNDNMTELSYNIISQLVKYVSANQGGLYLASENDLGSPVFEMKACYAYERRKFVDKFINFGEGLVGACAKEAKTIYLKKVPDTYLSITSGLGQANPNFLLLVPLKFNDETHGVLEVASFNQFAPYVVEFIEKVAESIASTIANVKINLRTAELLRDSQEQAEMLSSQEEEMRQNMEELQATQEESVRQTEKFHGYMNALDGVLIRAEFDAEGNLISANDKFIEKIEAPHFDDIYDKNITSFVHPDALSEFRQNWAKVVAENKWIDGELKCISYIDKTIYLSATLSRVNRNDGEMEKVLLLGIDITERKKVEFESNTIISAISNSLLKAELSTTGDMLAINEQLRKELALENSGVIHNINDFINELDKPAFEKAWMRLINNGIYEGVVNFTSHDNQSKALDINLIAIKNFNDDIVKIVLIGTDKSAIKAVEERYERLNEKAEQLEETLSKTDEELNKRVREVREQLAAHYKEVERIRVRNDKTVDNAPLAIVGFNAQGVIEIFNKKAAEIWGYQPNEIINLPVSKLFPKEHVQGDGFVSAICDVDRIKPISQREVVEIIDKNNNKANAYITLADARVAKDHNYVAYFEVSSN